MPDIRQAPPVSRLYTANYPPLLADIIIRWLYVEYEGIMGYFLAPRARLLLSRKGTITCHRSDRKLQ